jgi:metal-responsive CopG/Arc/MetJ family transcriptional regulator
MIIYNFCMRNVQVTVDEATLRQVDRVAKPLGLKRSEIVRQALREWLRRQAVERFEHDWIAMLEKRPDEAKRADDWLEAQAWDER